MLQINNLSNYPPHTIKHLPTSINQRLSKNSSKEEIFNKSKANYEKALKDSGFQSTKLDYKYIKKNWRQIIILFNPSFNKNVSTNEAKWFQNLIDKHFPKDNYPKTLT